MNWTGFSTLVEREFYRFIRLFNQTVSPPLMTTVMYILIFGYSLGSRIKEINGFSYIVYIIPGLIQMGVVNNSYANTSTSLYMARLERSIENVLVAPLYRFQIVTAYILGGVLRGMVVGLTILGGAAVFVKLPIHSWTIILVSLFFTSVLFGGLGIISALWAESWEKMATFTNYVITPFIYLGGVFYSIHMLPPFWMKVSLLNPIFHCIDLTRFGFLGVSDSPIWVSLTLLITSAVIVYLVCVALFWKGYKLLR